MSADAAGVASYPVVQEADATGVVAAVYADLLDSATHAGLRTRCGPPA